MYLHKGPWLWLQGHLVLAPLGPGCCHSAWPPPFHGWVTLRNWCPCPMHGTGVAWACGNLATRKQGGVERGGERKEKKNQPKESQPKNKYSRREADTQFLCWPSQKYFVLMFSTTGHPFPQDLQGSLSALKLPWHSIHVLHPPCAHGSDTICSQHPLLTLGLQGTGPGPWIGVTAALSWPVSSLVHRQLQCAAHHSMRGHGRHEPWRLDLTAGLSVKSQLQNAIKEWKGIPNPHQIWGKKGDVPNPG